MTTDTPTQEGGETFDVNEAAQAIEGLLGADEPPKTQESQTTDEAAPTQTDGEPAEVQAEATEKTDAQNEFETFDQLAEAAGLPLEKILNLKTKVKVDGAESEIPISEALKSYQLSKHVNNESQDLANQRKAFEAERQTRFQELNQRLNEALALSQVQEQELMEEHNSIDWATLRRTDAAEFAARKQEYNERWNRIQTRKQQVSFESQRLAQENETKAKEELSKFLDKQRSRLPELIPAWKDSKVAKAEDTEICNYLTENGFDRNEINQFADARLVKIARDAMLYQKATKKGVLESKKVMNLPKVVKPGTQVPKEQVRAERDKELNTRLRKSGTVEDAAAILMNRMK